MVAVQIGMVDFHMQIHNIGGTCTLPINPWTDRLLRNGLFPKIGGESEGMESETSHHDVYLIPIEYTLDWHLQADTLSSDICPERVG